MTDPAVRGPLVCGEPAINRLMGQVRRYAQDPPTVGQVAAVLHALADHTALQNATGYTGTTDIPLNVGRWLHAVGDQAEQAEKHG